MKLIHCHSRNFLYCVLALGAWLTTGYTLAGGQVSTPTEGSVTVHAAHPSQSYTFTPKQAKHWYIGDFVRWAVEDMEQAPGSGATLALGSSSMRMWKTIQEDLPGEIIHRGFGGSRMKDVLVYMDFFTRYQSPTVLVYEGDNDLAGPNSDIDRDFIQPTLEFIEIMQTEVPGVKIHFISIKPSVSRQYRMADFREANRRLERICQQSPDLYFIDIFEPMLDERGMPRADLLKSDKLHMNDLGYAIWTREVRRSLEAAARD
jgi:lysophospholipase L1-like esterase